MSGTPKKLMRFVSCSTDEQGRSQEFIKGVQLYTCFSLIKREKRGGGGGGVLGKVGASSICFFQQLQGGKIG